MKELNIAADKAYLDQVLEYVNEKLVAAGFSRKQIMKVDIAVEEIFCNVADYAYHPEDGKAIIRCDIEKAETTKAVIEFCDFGTPYNPLEREEPNIHLSAEERDIGGLGIYMTRKMMDSMEYRYEDGKNILIIKKQMDTEKD